MPTFAPHPWNTDFNWENHVGPFRRVTQEQAAAFDRAGFFVIENAVDAETIARLETEIEPFDLEVLEFLAARPNGRFSIAGVDTVSIAIHLVARSKALRDFCDSQLFADLCHDLIGGESRLYWDQAVYKRANGAEPVLWHQDNGYTYLEPQAYLTCWVALTDATEQNGCIQVLPGVHRQGTLAHHNTPLGFECFIDPEGPVSVPVKAGSIVVFSSLTPHATGLNYTDQLRKAYIVQFAPDGAIALRGDPDDGPAVGSELQNNPDRQFLFSARFGPLWGLERAEIALGGGGGVGGF
ncbi:MAG: phytanoyl-CoA dioxygenase family protein [Acidimicrobiia bacterium]|nr:phytanoyl-CoA dioxygenase family protein [Acidimicrobiia bacterium]